MRLLRLATGPLRAIVMVASCLVLAIIAIRAFVVDPDATSWQIALLALQAALMLVAYIGWWRLRKDRGAVAST